MTWPVGVVGVRNLADPIRIDSANPNDPMSQLAVVMLALFGQMERTYAVERAAHARAAIEPRKGEGWDPCTWRILGQHGPVATYAFTMRIRRLDSRFGCS